MRNDILKHPIMVNYAAFPVIDQHKLGRMVKWKEDKIVFII